MPPTTLFIDIETVSMAASFDQLPTRLQPFWEKKAQYLGAKDLKETKELFINKAALFAEFGKIVVIAIGYLKEEQGGWSLRVKGLADENEKVLLNDFCQILKRFPPNSSLCGHNIKEFDFPFLARRMICNNLKLPEVLKTEGKKPWEVNHIDTMGLWKFGEYKNFISLDLLAALFDIPSSKQVMHGSEVGSYYYEKKELNSIKKYCMEDVIVTAQVFRKLKGLPLIPTNQISEFL